jgi:hypothetical protein
VHAPLLEQQAPGNVLSVGRLHDNCPVVGANLLELDLGVTPQLCKQPSMSNSIRRESGTVHDAGGWKNQKLEAAAIFSTPQCGHAVQFHCRLPVKHEEKQCYTAIKAFGNNR